ncbi:BREX-2 system adenine-specific DNA-methyltransferase PglX [Ornithinimicrobium panacihumi]|uniref:BREX-2 system adenine-specific DNA-methyltransferase PglX n=1 Tax=Ornithinimicrobium panacihumi TaxID=2008449 RepID=UPI003F89DF3E
MTATDRLTADLKAQVLALEDDLRTRVAEDADLEQRWVQEHRDAVEAERTAASWTEFLQDRLTQSAVAWVLTSVFVRFCEDNGLVSPVWIAGPPARRQEALDAQLAYFRSHPEHTDREWLMQAVNHLKQLPATAALVDDHSPLWQVSPSGQAVTTLLDFWRSKDDHGELVHDLRDDSLSTRFLGDLYQDLSDHAKKTYALLQTPVFVEEFILDQTLEPALAERPLEGFRLIDPTCGSGHFLLGAFDRFVARWRQHDPSLSEREVVHRALDSVHGVDLNPFAVAIARFRLTAAALKHAGLSSLEDAPRVPLHLAVGDSLLHGRAESELNFGPFDPDAQLSGFTYSVEDLERLRDLLRPGRYDVVVGNPPYITVKDKTLNRRYRELYDTCKGKYALTVPFMERFFELARPDSDGPAGWTGQITSNSFMKRQFGSKLIEDFLVRQDLRLVADTSGAYIPGHGTPTVIIVGRRQRPMGNTVRAVLGVRGEPGRPENPEKGLVWRALVDNVGAPGHEDEWVTIANMNRQHLATFPWTLSGGGATDLEAKLSAIPRKLADDVSSIGIVAVIGEEDAFELRPGSRAPSIPLVLGEAVRDYFSHGVARYWPYDADLRKLSNDSGLRHMWPYRTLLSRTLMFGQTRRGRGLDFDEYMMLARNKLSHPLSITFAEVATHNHFALDRGGKIFNQKAPVIKLPEGSTEDDHLALLGVLNSSTACFWLKQNSYPKGGDPMGQDGARVSQQPWSDRYEFTGTTLQDFPLPADLPLARGRSLDQLAQRAASQTPAAVATEGAPTAAVLANARSAYAHLRGRMIAEQEELDWEVYGLYGLIEDDLRYGGDDLPDVALGERAFEIVLARRVAAGQAQTAWFERHGSTPVTEIPDRWPTAYRDLLQRRIDLIESDRSIGLLEKPEHKRRWASVPWEKQQEQALRGWLLDRLEDRRYWFDNQGRPAPRSVAQLADLVARDEEVMDVLALWEGRRDVPLTTSLTRLLVDEAVPYLAAYRLKETGMRKRAAWEETWDLQRREDAGEKVGPIPVPPKYTSADFRKASWWQARGKLDVPKERFILYPDAGRATDPTALLGWAGWDHAQQALALNIIIGERESEGAEDAQLVPLVAGLAELQPWVEQWHADIDPTYGMPMAEFCREQLQDRSLQVGRTVEELAAWRPEPARRGRKARS